MLSSNCSTDEEIEITRHSSQLQVVMFFLADSHVIPLNHGYLFLELILDCCVTASLISYTLLYYLVDFTIS
jgi:hypothetical protein